MRHLNAEEIIDYVTLENMGEENLNLCRNVNSHIRGCGVCLERLRKYLDIHDLYEEQNPGGNFKLFASEMLESEFSGSQYMQEK